MSNTSHNYFNKIDPYKGSYVTYNERDINHDYLVLFENEPWRSVDLLQSGIEGLTYGPAPIRKDASSFYTRDSLPITANEEIPITVGNYALRAPDIQFVQEHRVLPPQDMYLKTNTELEMELQVYHDGVRKQPASGIDTAHSRERIFNEFKQRMEYAESIPRGNTVARQAYENQAVNFLLANDPQLYTAIYGGSADKARSVHPGHITITSATHETMANAERQARQKELEELAFASSSMRESRKKISESLESSLGGTPKLSPIPSPKRGESKISEEGESKIPESKTPPSPAKSEEISEEPAKGMETEVVTEINLGPKVEDLLTQIKSADPDEKQDVFDIKARIAYLASQTNRFEEIPTVKKNPALRDELLDKFSRLAVYDFILKVSADSKEALSLIDSFQRKYSTPTTDIFNQLNRVLGMRGTGRPRMYQDISKRISERVGNIDELRYVLDI